MTSVHNLPLNSEVFMWYKSSNWTRFYCLLAVEDKTCCIQFPNRLTNFRSISVKPYFWSENTYNIKLEAPAELDELEVLLPTLEVLCKLTKPTKPAIKCG
jgi:hypothetical protein